MSNVVIAIPLFMLMIIVAPSPDWCLCLSGC